MKTTFKFAILIKTLFLAGCAPLWAGTISLSQNFGIGAALEFERSILPDTDTVILSSNGGFLSEGIAIGKIIRAHQLRTVVPASAVCLSACAEAFLGGVSMRIDGIVAFHRPQIQIPNASQTAFDQGLAGGTLTAIYRFEMGFGFELTRQINRWTSDSRLLSFDNVEALLRYKTDQTSTRLPIFLQF